MLKFSLKFSILFLFLLILVFFVFQRRIRCNVVGVTLLRACVHCYEIMTILLLLTNQCRLSVSTTQT